MNDCFAVRRWGDLPGEIAELSLVDLLSQPGVAELLDRAQLLFTSDRLPSGTSLDLSPAELQAVWVEDQQFFAAE